MRIIKVLLVCLIAAVVLWYCYVYFYSRAERIPEGMYIDRLQGIVIDTSYVDDDQLAFRVETPWVKGPPDYNFFYPVVYGCNSMPSSFTGTELELEYFSRKDAAMRFNREMSGFAPAILARVSNLKITHIVMADKIEKGLLGPILGTKWRTSFQKALGIDYLRIEYMPVELHEAIQLHDVFIADDGESLIVERGFKFYLVRDESDLNGGHRDAELGLRSEGIERYYVVSVGE